MVPIIENNLEIAQSLLEFCEVKHIASSYNETVIVDSKNLFQFKHPKLDSGSDSLSFLKTHYTQTISITSKKLRICLMTYGRKLQFLQNKLSNL